MIRPSVKRQVKSQAICKFACDWNLRSRRSPISLATRFRSIVRGGTGAITRDKISQFASIFLPPSFVNYFFIRFWYYRTSLFKFECAAPRKRYVPSRDGRVTRDTYFVFLFFFFFVYFLKLEDRVIISLFRRECRDCRSVNNSAGSSRPAEVRKGVSRGLSRFVNRGASGTANESKLYRAQLRPRVMHFSSNTRYPRTYTC